MHSLHRNCIALRFKQAAKHRESFEFQQVLPVQSFVQFDTHIEKCECFFSSLHDVCDLAEVLNRKYAGWHFEQIFQELFVLKVLFDVVRLRVCWHYFTCTNL
jgi:hypothetical protein